MRELDHIYVLLRIIQVTKATKHGAMGTVRPDNKLQSSPRMALAKVSTVAQGIIEKAQALNGKADRMR